MSSAERAINSLVETSNNLIERSLEGEKFDPSNPQHLELADEVIDFVIDNKYGEYPQDFQDFAKEQTKSGLVEKAKAGNETQNDNINNRSDNMFAEMAAEDIGPDTHTKTVEQDGGTTITKEVSGHNVFTGKILDNVGEQMGWDRDTVIDFVKDYRGNMADADFRNVGTRASFDAAVDNAFESNGIPVTKNSVGRLGGMVNVMEENQAQSAQSMESPSVDASATTPETMEVQTDASPVYDGPPAM